MYNFTIGFEYPWLLLLLIPALFFTVFHYFRSAKKYRRNRNRITSMVLHGLIMVLCISVFAGVAFLYDVPNEDNQIYLLVDMSDSGGESEQQRDQLVQDILDESRSQFNVGVVLFGYDQVLASELSYDTDEVYRRYLSAQLPDTSATDIAAAINYTRGLITQPLTAKIVLISDGLETDGDGLTAVRTAAADGIRIDTVTVTRPETAEVEIISLVTPDYNVAVGDSFRLTVGLRSSVEGPAVLTLYDNGEAAGTAEVELTVGTQEVALDYAFTAPGMHTLNFEVANSSDTLTQNNAYYSYIDIAVFDRILILERNTGESDELRGILTDETGYTVDVVNVRTNPQNVPASVDGLRQYDEIVLVNISNADLQGEGMPEGFDEMLNTYVHEYGGGLFTVGGNDDAGSEENAYNREDLRGTLYQEMLPVEAIDYTPPLGVVFLLDVSGSMFWGIDASGKTYLDLAVEAITACLQYSLSDRDYCGIMALGDPAVEISPMLPVPQMARIIASMNNLEMSLTGTPYASSIEAAGSALMALSSVEKRHIVIVSDGDPTDEGGYETYRKPIERFAKLGVTVTIVNLSPGGYDTDMERAAALGNGRYIKINNVQELTDKMRNELEAPEIKGVNYETFTPVIRTHTSVVSGVTQDDMPTLDGFYGTKIKEDATTVLVGEYVPIYAQWKYGEGSVGSFMCDLNGTWSSAFLESAAGQQILKNIAVALFPTRDIRPAEIGVSLSLGNYSTVMSVFTELNEGEVIEASYRTAGGGGSGETVTPIAMNPDNGYTRTTFVITQPGVHEVVVRKLDAAGNVLATSSVYRVFSYSAEYEVLSDRDGAAFLAELAAGGNGSAVADPWEVYEGFETALHVSYDPRLAFCLAALILFLLDIAVRKFKFKWPHELIREHRAKRSEKRD